MHDEQLSDNSWQLEHKSLQYTHVYELPTVPYRVKHVAEQVLPLRNWFDAQAVH
jgi:hypothetical protein